MFAPLQPSRLASLPFFVASSPCSCPSPPAIHLVDLREHGEVHMIACATHSWQWDRPKGSALGMQSPSTVPHLTPASCFPVNPGRRDPSREVGWYSWPFERLRKEGRPWLTWLYDMPGSDLGRLTIWPRRVSFQTALLTTWAGRMKRVSAHSAGIGQINQSIFTYGQAKKRTGYGSTAKDCVRNDQERKGDNPTKRAF